MYLTCRFQSNAPNSNFVQVRAIKIQANGQPATFTLALPYTTPMGKPEAVRAGHLSLTKYF